MVRTDIGDIPVDGYREGSAKVLLRPDMAQLEGEKGYKLQGRVVEISFRGTICRTVVEVNGTELTFDFPSSAPVPGAGETVTLSFEPERAVQVFTTDE